MTNPERNYPVDADIRIAAREGSKQYRLEHPDISGELSTPAMHSEMAKKMAADEHPDTDWKGWKITWKQ